MSENKHSNFLDLLPIGSLLNYSFSVPSYQRGYRWKADIQVKELLEDIWNYENDPLNPHSYYCLQPVVVKPTTSNKFELIDGQQRLTTLLLILHYFNETEFKTPKPHYSLSFDTRNQQNNFLADMKDPGKVKDSVDLYHLSEAYKQISIWFNEMEKEAPAVKGDFYSKLVKLVKVIWYEVRDNTSAIDIFTRLNIGKIPLTNAELIKALFLSKSTAVNSDNRTLKQISIAKEWDTIEQTLQQKDFWHFICNKPDKYDTRIEFIFDLMKGKKEDHEEKFTFHEFEKEFKEDKDDPEIITKIWTGVKEYFLTMEEWYMDRELYHLVGYLVAIGKNVDQIKNDYQNKTKSAFKKFLKKKARKTIPEDIKALNYNGDANTIRKTLLLFNIFSILNNPKSSIRFPFQYFNNQNSDLEHIKSQTDKETVGKDKEEWAITLLEYFSGEKWEKDRHENILKNIEHLDKKEIAFCHDLILILNKKDEGGKIFNELFSALKIYFKEEAPLEDEDNIWNLTLLDAGTNRMYKNAYFPVKRKHIINKEKDGIFIPLCTKNVFLKAYSQKLGEVMFWNQKDAEDYLEEINSTLQLNEQYKERTA